MLKFGPKFGMNLYLWTQTVTPACFPLIGSLRAMGFEGVEIPLVHGTKQHLPALRALLSDEGLACTTLSSVAPEADPSSPDPALRRQALDVLKWAIDASHALGSPTLSGPLYAAADPSGGAAGPTRDAEKRSTEVLHQACAYAAPAGIRLCLEFLNRFEGYLLNTAEQTVALIEATDAANLAIAYDTHHAHIEEHSIAGSMAAAGPLLAHTHVSESHRGTLGTGLVDWNAVFGSLKATGYTGWLMVEAFATDVQPLARSAHVWRNTFVSKEQVARDGLAFMRERCCRLRRRAGTITAQAKWMRLNLILGRQLPTGLQSTRNSYTAVVPCR